MPLNSVQMKALDLSGIIYGRLRVLSQGKTAFGGLKKIPRCTWVCICSCGKIITVRAGALCSGNTKSCGCLKTDKRPSRNLKYGAGVNYKAFPEYQSWAAAKTRCYNPNFVNFSDYGGRGIVMCDRWRNDFSAFFQDMGKCPNRHSLDRKNVHGNYEPENCRWATDKEQCRNRRSNIFVEVAGVKMVLPEACEKSGAKIGTIYQRIAKGKIDLGFGMKLLSKGQ